MENIIDRVSRTHKKLCRATTAKVVESVHYVYNMTKNGPVPKKLVFDDLSVKFNIGKSKGSIRCYIDNNLMEELKINGMDYVKWIGPPLTDDIIYEFRVSEYKSGKKYNETYILNKQTEKSKKQESEPNLFSKTENDEPKTIPESNVEPVIEKPAQPINKKTGIELLQELVDNTIKIQEDLNKLKNMFKDFFEYIKKPEL